jgi:hypothetical protein
MGDGDVQSLQPEEVKLKMAAGDTFDLNVVTDWCPDCSMRQHPNLPGFVSRLAGAGLQVFQLTVQHQRLIFSQMIMSRWSKISVAMAIHVPF